MPGPLDPSKSQVERVGFLADMFFTSVKLALCLLLFFAGSLAAATLTDPEEIYLSHFSVNGDRTINSKDVLLRLELDLDGDGQYEVLLSMDRDKDAQGLNSWSVYVKSKEGYSGVGKMSFDPRTFYLGPIDDLGDYGLVTFKPSTGGEGLLVGYLFDGKAVRAVDIAVVRRDPESYELRGQSMVDKYMSRVTEGVDPLIKLNAGTIAQKFGIKVKTVVEGKTQSNSFSAPTDSSSTIGPAKSSSPGAGNETWSIPWTWFIVLVLLGGIGGAIWLKRPGAAK